MDILLYLKSLHSALDFCAFKFDGLATDEKCHLLNAMGHVYEVIKKIEAK